MTPTTFFQLLIHYTNKMETNVADQIKKFKEFIETTYYNTLLDNIRKGDKYLVIDFTELSKYDPDLATELLDSPEETLKAIEKSIEQFDIENSKNLRIRIKNIPKTNHILIGDIRSNLIGKFVKINGYLLRKSKVLPKVTSCKYECPVCGNIFNILQIDEMFKEPTTCSCGRKGKFSLLDKDYVDAQSLVVQEKQEELQGTEQPQTMHVILTEDLVVPHSTRRLNPGINVSVIGIVKEVPIVLRSGAKSTNFDLILDANYIEGSQETFEDINISEKEEEQIKEISKKNPLKLMSEAIAFSLYGHDQLKEAIALQFVGGVKKTLEDGRDVRGDSHILVIGDPGGGKTALLKFLTKLAPKWQYVSGGGGTSGRGLSAAVVKDDMLNTYTLDAGAAVLADGGILFFDELDKISNEEKHAIHEVMESQCFSVHKAGINQTLMARATILAAANPKHGRFDPYGLIADQLNLEPSLINRFDLIFPIKDIPNEIQDDKLSRHVLKAHRKKLNVSNDTANNPFFNNKFAKKYIAYARRNIFPELTDEAEDVIHDYYTQLRKQGIADDGSGKPTSIPINARYLEGMVRLAESAARLNLSKLVTKEDATKAVQLIDSCLRQFGFDHKTNKFDIDIIATGMSSSKRDKFKFIQEIIKECEGKVGKIIPIENILNIAKERGIPVVEAEDLLSRLRKEGEIYEPRSGFIGTY